jgi:hypothetical protein
MTSWDPRLVEGYHPTTCEQFRLFVVGLWNPRKFSGMLKGLSYVKHANEGAPQVNQPFLEASLTMLDGTSRNLSTFLSDTPLILNFGSYT